MDREFRCVYPRGPVLDSPLHTEATDVGPFPPLSFHPRPESLALTLPLLLSLLFLLLFTHTWI